MLNLDPKNKLAGILAPLFALRGSQDLGIGDTQALQELIDWCSEVGLGAIQILPINETGSDHSPYHILSSIAIEPSTISTTPELLPDLTTEDFISITSKFDLSELRANEVKYAQVKALKLELLGAAFRRLNASPTRLQNFKTFCEQESDWLTPYSLFRSIMHLQGQSEFFEHWPPEQRTFPSAQKWAKEIHNAKEVTSLQNFYSYIQWIAFSQWQSLREYAESRNVALIGDIPVGISIHSVDVWKTPHLFYLNWFCGAPPEKNLEADGFTRKWGQNWGFPLYNWPEMARDNYQWWRRRLHSLYSIFHMLRIDHVLGFYRMYSFPWQPSENNRFLPLTHAEASHLTGGILPQFMERDDSTEENRLKNQSQGEILLRLFLEETGPYRLIAEDLGAVPPYVRPSLEALKIPGIKIPLWEKNETGSLIAGDEYPRLSLATYTTHDHPSLKKMWEQWLHDVNSTDELSRLTATNNITLLLEFARQPTLDISKGFTEEIHCALIYALFASNSWLVIPPITDFFGMSHQFNIPGSKPELNWKIRLKLPINLWLTQKKVLISKIQNLLILTHRKAFA